MKKVLSVLLAACLCLSLAPVTALAADGDHTHCVCARAEADHAGESGSRHAADTVWTRWTQTDSLPTAEGHYYLLDNVTLTAPWEPQAMIALCLNGHTVTGADGQDVITVAPGGAVEITDCVGGGQITHAPGTAGRGVTIRTRVLNTTDGGSFALYGGSITGNSAEDGGGVYVEEADLLAETNPTSNPIFTLYGGSVAGNTARNDGGGVYAKGLVHLAGGSVTGNAAGRLGGGIYQYPHSLQTLSVSGAVNVTGNTVDSKTGNLCLDGQSIVNADRLNDDARIGVHTPKAPDGYQVVPSVTYSGGAGKVSCFFSDDSDAGVVKYLEHTSPARLVLWDDNKHFVGNGSEEYHTLHQAVAAAHDGDTLTILDGYLPSGEAEGALPVYQESSCRVVAMDQETSDASLVTIDKDLTLDCGGKLLDYVELKVESGKTLTLKGTSGGLLEAMGLTAGHVVVESGKHGGIELAADSDGGASGNGSLTVKGGSVESVALYSGTLELTGGELGALAVMPMGGEAVIGAYRNVVITGMEVEEGQPPLAIQIMDADQAAAKAIADALEAKVAAGGGMLMSGNAPARREVQEIKDGDTVMAYVVTYAGPLTIHTHAWADGWETDNAHHWHSCSAPGCGVTEDSGKDGYAEHTKTWVNTDPAQHWETCAECGWTGEKTAHAFGEWAITREATAILKGSKERVCSVCGFKETQEIPATGSGSGSGSGGSVGGYVEPIVISRFGKDKSELPFTDVKTSDDWYESVKYVYEKKWMEGTSATTFEPQGELTRAMFAAVLYRAAGSPETMGDLAFTDTETDTWYSKAILWAAQTGVLRGYGDGRFGPEDTVSVEMLNMVLARQKGEDPQWTGDSTLAHSATRAEIAQAMAKDTRK